MTWIKYFNSAVQYSILQQFNTSNLINSHFKQNGGTAVDAVEAAVRVLERNELFNAGRGSFLNCDGEVECDAMIMEGDTLKNGSDELAHAAVGFYA